MHRSLLYSSLLPSLSLVEEQPRRLVLVFLNFVPACVLDLSQLWCFSFKRTSSTTPLPLTQTQTMSSSATANHCSNASNELSHSPVNPSRCCLSSDFDLESGIIFRSSQPSGLRSNIYMLKVTRMTLHSPPSMDSSDERTCQRPCHGLPHQLCRTL